MSELIKYLNKGKQSAKTAKQLAIEMNVPYDRTDINMRNIIREAIKEGELIASTNKGFYIIETQGELIEYIESLQGRIAGIRKRIKNLLTNWEKNDC